jgi:hypothetical protein
MSGKQHLKHGLWKEKALESENRRCFLSHVIYTPGKSCLRGSSPHVALLNWILSMQVNKIRNHG